MKKYMLAILYFLFSILVSVLIFPPCISFFHRTGHRWIYIFLLSLSISFLSTPLSMAIAKKFKILDIPDYRKAHCEPTPLLGGLGIYFAFIITLALYAVLSRQLVGLLVSASIIAIIGIVDDYRGLRALYKLIFQILAVVIVIYNGIHFVFLPLGFFTKLGEWLLTGIWIIGITNAVNFLDGLDGLATGSSAIIAFYLTVVAFQSNQPYLGWAAIAVIGGCLGFLPYNFKPRNALIFLGDTGSTFLGFVLASLAVMGKWGPENIIKTFTPPLLIFGILIFDMIHISIFRILSHKVNSFKEWIEFVGRDHLHHRVASLGLNKKQTVIFIFLFEILLGAGALLVREIHAMASLFLLVQGTAILIIIGILEFLGNKRPINMNDKGHSSLLEHIKNNKKNKYNSTHDYI